MRKMTCEVNLSTGCRRASWSLCCLTQSSSGPSVWASVDILPSQWCSMGRWERFIEVFQQPHAVKCEEGFAVVTCVSYSNPLTYFITRPPAAEAARGGEQEGRLRRDEELQDAPGDLRQSVVGVGGTQEEQGQEWLAL